MQKEKKLTDGNIHQHTDNMDKVKIENLVTELHNVLNSYYANENERNKAIRDTVNEIYVVGWSDGYTQAEINYGIENDLEDDED